MPDIPTPYKDLTDPGDPRDSLQKLIDAAKSPSHCAPLESEKDPLQLVKDAIDESKKKAGTSWKKIQASLAEEDTAIDPEKNDTPPRGEDSVPYRARNAQRARCRPSLHDSGHVPRAALDESAVSLRAWWLPV